jgi:hypothetical protein
VPSSYPSALDALTNPTSGNNLTSPSHAGQHTNANDAIEAIQAELGVLPKGSYASVVARLDDLPMGVLGYAQTTSAAVAFTAESDIISVTVTVGTSRRIKVSAQALVALSVADGRIGMEIKEGATYLWQGSVSPNTTSAVTVAHSVVLTPTSGAHTYKLALVRREGTGSLTLPGGTTIATFILVEDLGST